MDQIQEGKFLSKKMRQLLQGRPFVLIWEGTQGNDGFITNVTQENAALVLRDAAEQIETGQMKVVQHRHRERQSTQEVAARCSEVADVVVEAIGEMQPAVHPVTVMAGLGVVVGAFLEHIPQEMREGVFESWVVNLRADLEENLRQAHPLPSHLHS